MNFAKEYQKGRGTNKVPNGTFDFTEGLISTDVLVLCKQHQKGRAEKKSAFAEFTEGWFRDSGLYDLYEAYQLYLNNIN